MWLIFFVVYLFFVGRQASLVLTKFFDFSNSSLTKVLGVFTGFISLGWIAGAAILFLPLTFWVLAAVFAINAVVYILLVRFVNNAKQNAVEVVSDDSVSEEAPGVKFGVLAFLVLEFYGFYSLYASRTGNTLLTPWQTIKPEYIFVFLFSTLILGILIFSKLRTKTILLFLILQTFLLHSYFPLTHKLLYGADQWRHLATETRLAAEKPLNLVVYGSKQIINTLNPGRLSYSQLWATSVILSRALSIPLIQINIWLLPILWSVIFPLLLFEMGVTLGWTKKNSLLFAWLGLLPFAWQAAGSFTLPVNFGLLVWLFLMLLILKRVKSSRKEQIALLALAGLGSIFGYVLYFILFWLGWLVSEVLKQTNTYFLTTNKQSRMATAKIMTSLFAVLFVSFFIPAVELLFGYSQFDSKINWLSQLKQSVGNFSAYYLASGPIPHDITTGNVIFNQVPLAAFVSNFFTQWRWWILIFMICFFAIFIYGLVQAYRSRQVAGQWLVIMTAGTLGSYAISNYFLVGSHLLARRLDGALGLFLMVIFFYGLEKIFRNLKQLARVLIVVILALATITSYSLGPDTYTLSDDEYQAANYVWSQEKNNNKHCVLGGTYFLLALEAVSGKEIIGGGFPIDASFAQPERVELYKQMNIAINNDLLNTTAALTKTDHCWFVGERANFAQQGILGGNRTKVFGDVAVMRYNTALDLRFKN